MKKTIYYNQFEKLSKRIFNKLKSDYLERVDNARLKVNVHNEFQQEIVNPKFNEIQREPAQLSRFMIEVKDDYNRDKRKEIPEIFEERIKTFEAKKRNAAIKYLAQYEAYGDLFYNFWYEESEKFREENEGDENLGLEKFDWLGTQKNLAELFIELENKGWIKKIDRDLIKQYFTKSTTISEILKPSVDKTGKPTFEKVYTKAYKKAFNNIALNKTTTKD